MVKNVIIHDNRNQNSAVYLNWNMGFLGQYIGWFLFMAHVNYTLVITVKQKAVHGMHTNSKDIYARTLVYQDLSLLAANIFRQELLGQ